MRRRVCQPTRQPATRVLPRAADNRVWHRQEIAACNTLFQGLSGRFVQARCVVSQGRKPKILESCKPQSSADAASWASHRHSVWLVRMVSVLRHRFAHIFYAGRFLRLSAQ